MEFWPAALREFAAKWTRYKASRRVMDFRDLIETGVREIRIAPKSFALQSNCPQAIDISSMTWKRS
jgi:hypothetical protein